MRNLLDQFAMSSDLLLKIGLSLAVAGVLWLLKKASCSVVRRKVPDLGQFYHWRRFIVYVYSLVGLILIARIWIRAIGSLATILGLIGGGLAIALHDAVANLAGWMFIVFRQPFKVGQRIEIGGIRGDVIDIRLFAFSMVEIGIWVGADQSTGRIVHIPNSKVLREPLANYELGFEYVWHEVPVLITFESNWEKAKSLLMQIARDKAEHLSQGAQEQIRRAAMSYLIFFRKLTPIVYTTVKENGVLLTIRYIVKPRSRRGSEEEIWEAVLREFAKHDDISLAYPTTRFYRLEERKD